MIEVFGLFHKDKNQKNRIKKFNEILNEHPFRIFVYQMEELLEDDYPEYKKEILESFDIKKEKLYFINHTVIPEEFSKRTLCIRRSRSICFKRRKKI